MNSNKRIFITGIAGFVGFHLARHLKRRGDAVCGLDNFNSYYDPLLKRERAALLKEEGILVFEGDVCDQTRLLDLFNRYNPSHLVHLAAQAGVRYSLTHPDAYLQSNLSGMVHLLEACRTRADMELIFASSSSIYGNQKTLPLKEDMLPNPMSPYGLQKYTGELNLRLFSSLYGLGTVSLRYFNVYGPRIDVNSDYSLIVGKFLKLNKEGKPLTIFGDGKQSRAFCYIEDVVEANIKAMERDQVGAGEVINIGAKIPVSVEQIAEAIGGEKEYLPPRAGDPLHSAADLSRAKELLGWEPKVSFKEGLKKTKAWFEEQNY